MGITEPKDISEMLTVGLVKINKCCILPRQASRLLIVISTTELYSPGLTILMKYYLMQRNIEYSKYSATFNNCDANSPLFVLLVLTSCFASLVLHGKNPLSNTTRVRIVSS